MPSAQTSTLKPAGTFSLSTGKSLDALPVMWGAKGCRGELACSALLPCCHEDGCRNQLLSGRLRRRPGYRRLNPPRHHRKLPFLPPPAEGSRGTAGLSALPTCASKCWEPPPAADFLSGIAAARIAVTSGLVSWPRNP